MCANYVPVTRPERLKATFAAGNPRSVPGRELSRQPGAVRSPRR